MKSYHLPDGAAIPALGLGTWKAKEGDVRRAVKEAIAIGYRHIDCASIYGNEGEIGAALHDVFDEGTVTRDDVWITSKLWNDAHEPDRVMPALRKTLGDLRIDRLDLYLMHWPIALRPGVFVPEGAEDFKSLDDVPLIETWRAMEACRRAGLCRHIGLSNFSVKKLRAIIEGATIKPVTNQVEAHPFLAQTSLIDACRSDGVLVTAYSPLGSRDRPAVLTRENEPSLLENPIVAEIARQRHLSPAQVLIAWAINRGTIVIPKSVDPGRLRENFDAAHVTLDAEAMTALAGLDRHYRFVLGSFWEVEGGPYTVADLWDETQAAAKMEPSP